MLADFAYFFSRVGAVTQDEQTAVLCWRMLEEEL